MGDYLDVLLNDRVDAKELQQALAPVQIRQRSMTGIAAAGPEAGVGEEVGIDRQRGERLEEHEHEHPCPCPRVRPAPRPHHRTIL